MGLRKKVLNSHIGTQYRPIELLFTKKFLACFLACSYASPFV
jgi:hypothetical protein